MNALSHKERAVLIDLDGTLVDSASDIVAAANRMLVELGAVSLSHELVASFIGNGVPTLVRRVIAASPTLADADPAEVKAVFDRHYCETNGRFSRVYPGVMEGLLSLQEAGFQLGCVTNKPRALTDALLDTFALTAFFQVVVAGDSLPQMKPDPAPLLHACAVLQVAPADAVLVGDSHVDVAASRAAAMPNFIVRYGYPGPAGLAALEADQLVDSLAEVALILQRKPVAG